MRNYHDSSYMFNVSVSTTVFIEKPNTKAEKNKYFREVMWERQTVSLPEFEKLIKEGRSFCYCFDTTSPFGAKQKTKDNFESTSLITLDIDDSTVPMEQYVNQLPFKPTLYHTTCSNGVKGYRFRLMYVFDKPFEGVQQYEMGYRCLLYALGIELKDNCMLSANQFFYGNPYPNSESVITNFIYIYPEWLDSVTPQHDIRISSLQTTTTNKGCHQDSFSSPLHQLHLNDTFLNDYRSMSTREFLAKYNYPVAPSETPLIAVDERYYIFPENYYMLPRKTITRNNNGEVKYKPIVCRWKDGEKRHKKIFIAGKTLQKLIPNIQPEHLFYLLVKEIYYYYDNTDFKFTRNYMLKLLSDIMESDYELDPCEHGKFRVNKEWCREHGVSAISLANKIKKELRVAEIDFFFQPELSNKENLAILKENGIAISLSTLQRYKRERRKKQDQKILDETSTTRNEP